MQHFYVLGAPRWAQFMWEVGTLVLEIKKKLEKLIACPTLPHGAPAPDMQGFYYSAQSPENKTSPSPAKFRWRFPW